MIAARQLRVLQERLERRLAETEALLRDTADAGQPVRLDQTSVGRLSRMDALQQQAVRAGLREGQLRERRRVHAALERIREALRRVLCLRRRNLPRAAAGRPGRAFLHGLRNEEVSIRSARP